MKKVIFLFAMVFAVSMAMAQNDAFVKQIAADGSSVTVTQLGDQNLIGGPSLVTDAADVTQFAALQIAGVPSTFEFSQIGSGNEGLVRQESWDQSRAAVLDWVQLGDDNTMKLNQNAKYNTTVNGLQKGNRNVFAGLSNIGPNGGMTVDADKYATQIDAWNSASIEFKQIGNDNEVGLYQYNGRLRTKFDLLQNGDDNTFVGYQHNEVGSVDLMNLMDVTQTGSNLSAECYQKNLGPNGGNNFVVVQ